MDKDKKTKPLELPKWKYYCPACSGYADFALEPKKFKAKVCRNCGTTIDYKEGNWIEIFK